MTDERESPAEAGADAHGTDEVETSAEPRRDAETAGEGETPAASDVEGPGAAAVEAVPPDVDSADRPELFRWSRVAIGFVVIAAIHALLAFTLVPALRASGPIAAVLIGVIPYLIGGGVLGLVSDDDSLLEPFYAAVLPAFSFPFLVELGRAMATTPPNVAQTMARMQWISVFLPVLLYVLVALFGCWVVEKLPRGRRVTP